MRNAFLARIFGRGFQPNICRKGWVVALLAACLMCLAALAGCGRTDAEPAPSATVTASPPAPDALRVALASVDIAVGSNRIVFGIIDGAAGAVHAADVQVSSFYLPQNGAQPEHVQTVDAVFRAWPVTPRGVYTAQLEFDRAGEWGIGAVVDDGSGAARQASVRVRVNETAATLPIGAPAPRSASKTLSDVNDISHLTTDIDPDAELYQMTIAEALTLGKPMMVAFSTPAFCKTATCGPQLDVIKALKADYGDQMSFIHIEVYDNPHLIEGDLASATLSPTLTEWGLPTEPWTFIVDSDGNIAAKFEAFTTREELEAAVIDTLR